MTSHDHPIVPTAESVASMVHALFPYAEERSLLGALETAGSRDIARLREHGGRVPGVSPEALEGLVAYAQFLLVSDASEARALHSRRAALAPEVVSRVQRFLSAILLDASLAFIEGQEQPPLSDDTALARTLTETARTRVNRRASRTIPFGTYSDDSQFLLSGAIGAAMNEPSSFALSLVQRWRAWSQKGIWRGTGRRMKAFLNGDPRGFSGPPTLGDVLRLAPFTCLPSGEVRSQALEQYAAHVSLTKPQVLVVEGLSAALDRITSGQLPAARSQLRALASELGAMDRSGSTHAFMIRALTDMEIELLGRASISGFLKRASAYSSDWDTLGFIAGLFHPTPAQALRDTSLLLPHLERRDSILGVLLAATVPTEVADLSNTLTSAAWALTSGEPGGQLDGEPS